MSSDIDRPSRFLFLCLGIGLILVGAYAIISLAFASAVTAFYVVYLGVALIISGMIHAVQAFYLRKSSDFFLAVVLCILDIVVGFLIITHVQATMAILTLMLAILFLSGGLMRIIVSVALRFPTWLWSVLSGLIGVLLGISIWQQWPFDSYWVIGVFIGIEMLFRGLSLVMLALATPPAPVQTHGASVP